MLQSWAPCNVVRWPQSDSVNLQNAINALLLQTGKLYRLLLVQLLHNFNHLTFSQPRLVIRSVAGVERESHYCHKSSVEPCLAVVWRPRDMSCPSHVIMAQWQCLCFHCAGEWGWWARQIDNDQTEMEIFPVIVILLQSSLNNNPSAGREATASIILTFWDKWNRIYFQSEPGALRSVINVDQRYLSKLWPAAKFGSIFTLKPHQKGQISRSPHPDTISWKIIF